nr:hypothetical protein [Pandoravirus aubagnensis]
MKSMPRLFGAGMSAGASILTGPNGRLSVIGLYQSCGHAPAATDKGCTLPTMWWPRDIAQWRTVSAAAARCLLHGRSADDATDAIDVASYDAPYSAPDAFDAMDRNVRAANIRLVGLVVDRAPILMACCDATTPAMTRRITIVDEARCVHVSASDETSNEWTAFCRLAALRDVTLWRALSVDPTAYGERGAHVATSILRTEEAIARRRRFDPALVDADEIAALRRAFVAVTDGYRADACAPDLF